MWGSVDAWSSRAATLELCVEPHEYSENAIGVVGRGNGTACGELLQGSQLAELASGTVDHVAVQPIRREAIDGSDEHGGKGVRALRRASPDDEHVPVVCRVPLANILRVIVGKVADRECGAVGGRRVGDLLVWQVGGQLGAEDLPPVRVGEVR